VFRSLTRWLTRAPAQILIWLLLLVCVAPQHPLLVCTMGCCGAAAAVSPAQQPVKAEHCSCCQHEPAAKTEGERGGAKNRSACQDCCVDLALLTRVGPMPRPVNLPDVDPPCIAVVPAEAADEDSSVATALPLHCTGPPRTDARTALIATTNLRR
jgi:hypothetical protein